MVVDNEGDYKKYSWSIFICICLVLAMTLTPLVKATNESSYKYGFFMGNTFARGDACDDTDGDCTSSAIDVCNTSANVTNHTSCVDGFVNSWRVQCMSHLKLCAIQVLAGIFPGTVEDNKTMVSCYAKYDGNTEGDVNTLILPRHLAVIDHNNNPSSAFKACAPIRGKD